MIARKMPNDQHRAEVVFAAKMKELFLDLDRCPIGMSLRDRRPVHQTGVTVFAIGITPPAEAAAADAKISTCLRDMTRLINMLKNTKLANDGALTLAHEHLLRPRIESLLEMSREYRLIYNFQIVLLAMPR